LVLTSATPGNVYLVNRLLGEFDVCAMVVESPPPAATQAEKMQRRSNLVRRHGWPRVINKLAYNWVRSRLLSYSDSQTVRSLLFPSNKPVEYSRTIPTTDVANINDQKCVDFVASHAPDVIAVCGTTVIKPQVFGLARSGTINIHTGITPEFRSADPIFWAVYHNQPDKVGVTIHFVDRGIDTGPILAQEAVPILGRDSLAAIYARCIKRGADLYCMVLKKLANEEMEAIQRSGVEGRAFYSIDLGLIQYLVFRWRFSRLKRQIRRERQKTAATSIRDS
jgi:methionyl-tRNA formyltransferase